MSGPTINRSESSGDIWTPQDFRAAVVRKFGVPIWDLAATAASVFSTGGWFGPDKGTDALVQPWHGVMTLDGKRGPLWLNPPYSAITPWAGKCVDESRLGAEILLLVPGSIGANWYRDYVHPYADVYSIGRLKFDNCFSRKTGLPIHDQYPKDLALCHYLWRNETLRTGDKPLIFWDWRKEGE